MADLDNLIADRRAANQRIVARQVEEKCQQLGLEVLAVLEWDKDLTVDLIEYPDHILIYEVQHAWQESDLPDATADHMRKWGVFEKDQSSPHRMNKVLTKVSFKDCLTYIKKNFPM